MPRHLPDYPAKTPLIAFGRESSKAIASTALTFARRRRARRQRPGPNSPHNTSQEDRRTAMVKTLIGIRVSLGLIGIGLGIFMGIRHDFVLMQGHAHLNLLAFVTMFLSARYYRAVPQAARSKLARLQAIVGVTGAAAFPAGVACVVLGGRDHVGAIGIAGAVTVLLSMALFAAIMLRT